MRWYHVCAASWRVLSDKVRWIKEALDTPLIHALVCAFGHQAASKNRLDWSVIEIADYDMWNHSVEDHR